MVFFGKLYYIATDVLDSWYKYLDLDARGKLYSPDGLGCTWLVTPFMLTARNICTDLDFRGVYFWIDFISCQTSKVSGGWPMDGDVT